MCQSDRTDRTWFLHGKVDEMSSADDVLPVLFEVIPPGVEGRAVHRATRTKEENKVGKMGLN